MKSLNISKYMLLTTCRRFWRVVRSFPLMLIFAVLLILLAGNIPDVLRTQLAVPMSYVPEAQIYFLGVKVFSLLTGSIFVGTYVLSLFLPDILRHWPALSASPTRLGVLWLGINGIALCSTLFLTFWFMSGVPALFRENFSLAPLPVVLNYISLLMFIILMNSMAICVWKISQALAGPHVSAWISYPVKILLPLVVISFLGLPLATKQPYKIFIHPGFFIADIFAQKDLQTAWAGFALLSLSTLAFLVITGFLLNHYWSLQSDYSNYAQLSGLSWNNQISLNFIWLESKRYFRQKLLMLMFILLSLMSMLFTWAISQLSQEVSAVIPSLFAMQILPYIGATIGLIGLSQDHTMQWIYRSSPWPRLKYLWLKLLGISSLSLLFTSIMTLSISIADGWMAFVLLVPVILKTTGMIGIAFLISGIVKNSSRDVLGQIVPSVFFFLASGLYQIAVDAAASYTNIPDLEAFNPLWILPFVLAPWIILRVEGYLERNG